MAYQFYPNLAVLLCFGNVSVCNGKRYCDLLTNCETQSVPTKDYTTIQSKKFESKIFIQDFVQIVDITLEAFFEPCQSDSKVCQKKKRYKEITKFIWKLNLFLAM